MSEVEPYTRIYRDGAVVVIDERAPFDGRAWARIELLGGASK